MSQLVQNFLSNGYNLLQGGYHFVANLRNIEIWTTLQHLKNPQQLCSAVKNLGSITKIFKCFSDSISSIRFCSNPFTPDDFSPDDHEIRAINELEYTAKGILTLRTIIYLPMLLSPINLKWGNILIDIASLAVSFLLLQKEIIVLNRNDKNGPDEINAKTFLTWSRVQHLSFITSYATSVISVGLDLLHRFAWTAKIIGFTGSMGTICSTASIVLLVAATTFQIIANREAYKNQYVKPAVSRIRAIAGKLLTLPNPI